MTFFPNIFTFTPLWKQIVVFLLIGEEFAILRGICNTKPTVDKVTKWFIGNNVSVCFGGKGSN